VGEETARHACALARREGPEVARAFALSALIADIAGVLALAVAAAETPGSSARRRAWDAVAALAPAVRETLRGAGHAPGRPLRRCGRLVDQIAELATSAPAAAGTVPLGRLPPLPTPDGAAPTLRRFFLDAGPGSALDLLDAAAVALPALAPECDAWATDLRAAFRAL
jgi:hypothetical protein